MSLRHVLSLPAVIIGTCVSVVTPASSYEVITHRLISEAALRASTAQGDLTSLLTQIELEDQANDKTLTEWAREGAGREDDRPRFVNHFHNPLAAWETAGLGGYGYSSIEWAQVSRNDWSWARVRHHLHEAITHDTPDRRNAALASVLRGLGHQIHLVQDAASPPHTRNDIHAFGYQYEKFVADIQQQDPDFPLQHLQSPIMPDPAWRSLPPHPIAPLAVAGLIDTELYQRSTDYIGVNPEITAGRLIGLAEYTNANFLSEDSLWDSRSFRYPRRSAAAEVAREVRLPSGEVVRRRYYQKIAEGDPGHLLATVGFLRDYHVRYRLDPTRGHHTAALDEMVYRDYARKLVPRAVGSSIALIDHFFSGALRSRITFQQYLDPAIGSLSKDRITIHNASSDEALEGSFALYSEDQGGRRTWLAEWPLTIPAGRSSEPLVVPLLPAPSLWTMSCLIVFRGKLGSETDVVATSLDWGLCLHEDEPAPPPTDCPPFCD